MGNTGKTRGLLFLLTEFEKLDYTAHVPTLQVGRGTRSRQLFQAPTKY